MPNELPPSSSLPPRGGASFRMYPRGFLGAVTEPQNERTSREFDGEVRGRMQYQLNSRNSSINSVSANSAVEELYSQYIKREPHTSSFEFRETLLIAALFAFGTINFKSWYYSQHQSPMAGDLHNRFLVDTLRFISTARRSMSLETWGALISITDEGNNIGTVHDYAKTFFEYSGHSDLRQVIQIWCSKSGGLEDMLGTLHILFGRP